ncbi:hypothetical protein ACOME3_004941 [Neoechinorhynchus agilis]
MNNNESLKHEREVNGYDEKKDFKRITAWRKNYENFAVDLKGINEQVEDLVKDKDQESNDDDRVRCPHCCRRFFKSSAGRHIPPCARRFAEIKLKKKLDERTSVYCGSPQNANDMKKTKVRQGVIGGAERKRAQGKWVEISSTNARIQQLQRNGTPVSEKKDLTNNLRLVIPSKQKVERVKAKNKNFNTLFPPKAQNFQKKRTTNEEVRTANGFHGQVLNSSKTVIKGINRIRTEMTNKKNCIIKFDKESRWRKNEETVLDNRKGIGPINSEHMSLESKSPPCELNYDFIQRKKKLPYNQNGSTNKRIKKSSPKSMIGLANKFKKNSEIVGVGCLETSKCYCENNSGFPQERSEIVNFDRDLKMLNIVKVKGRKSEESKVRIRNGLGVSLERNFGENKANGFHGQVLNSSKTVIKGINRIRTEMTNKKNCIIKFDKESRWRKNEETVLDNRKGIGPINSEHMSLESKSPPCKLNYDFIQRKKKLPYNQNGSTNKRIKKSSQKSMIGLANKFKKNSEIVGVGCLETSKCYCENNSGFPQERSEVVNFDRDLKMLNIVKVKGRKSEESKVRIRNGLGVSLERNFGENKKEPRNCIMRISNTKKNIRICKRCKQEFSDEQNYVKFCMFCGFACNFKH